ncbi:hypothetical protein HYQ46_005233 [Verticillium longisporum]|nr:hypothetical protein HYQ46_005233 [Verticillium longisporum]
MVLVDAACASPTRHCSAAGAIQSRTFVDTLSTIVFPLLLYRGSPKANNTHFQGPDTPDPHLELSLDTLNILKLNAFPPAPPGRFPPEKEEFLSHTNRVAAHLTASDVTTQACQSKAAYHRLVGLSRPVTP